MPVKKIEDFGYTFNSEGCLRKMDDLGRPTDQPFQFNISDNHQECQQHYEELGDAITHFVYDLLENSEGLIKLPVPSGSDASSGTFVFASRDYWKQEQLLVLIHGSGVVRAGQWARSLIINDNLYTGSQIPYIRRALTQEYGVLIMNTNDNYRTVNNEPTKIPKSGNPTEHAYYVWDKYVVPTQAKHIAIVAHSYGGVIAVELAKKFRAPFEQRVKAVAFTDSVHSGAVTNHLRQVGRNWVASDKPIDQELPAPAADVKRVSAGHSKHEMTSHSAIMSIFEFIFDTILINALLSV